MLAVPRMMLGVAHDVPAHPSESMRMDAGVVASRLPATVVPNITRLPPGSTSTRLATVTLLSVHVAPPGTSTSPATRTFAMSPVQGVGTACAAGTMKANAPAIKTATNPALASFPMSIPPSVAPARNARHGTGARQGRVSRISHAFAESLDALDAVGVVAVGSPGAPDQYRGAAGPAGATPPARPVGEDKRRRRDRPRPDRAPRHRPGVAVPVGGSADEEAVDRSGRGCAVRGPDRAPDARHAAHAVRRAGGSRADRAMGRESCRGRARTRSSRQVPD